MTFQQMLLIILVGGIGGALRGLLGIAKELVTKKDISINWLWFWVSIGVSGIIGVILALFFVDDLRLALLSGYAGTDFIEGLMKLKLQNKWFGGNKVPKSKFRELINKTV